MISVEKNETKQKIALSTVLILLPLIIVCIESIVFDNGIHLKSFIPANNNDEYGWYLQIESLVKYNKPLGYFGYNEYHASMGNLSSWPVLTYIPYVIIGKIIGWNNYSMVIANIGLLSFSLLMFLLITKPSNKRIISLIVVYFFCCLTTHYYTTLSMSEACRTSIGIVLASILIYLYRNRFNKNRKFIYILISIFCIISVTIFYPFIVFVFYIFFLMQNNRRKNIRIIVSIFLSMIVIVFSIKFNSVFSAKYFEENTVDKIMNIFLSKDAVIEKMAVLLKDELEIFVSQMGNTFKQGIVETNGMFFIEYLFTIILVSVNIILSKNREIFMYLLIALVCFFLGDVFLYSFGHIPKLERVLSNSFTPIALILSYYWELNKYEAIFVLSSLLLFPHFAYIQKRSFNNQHDTILKINEINNLRDELTYNVFDIKTTNTEWENTIDKYGDSFFLKSYTLSLPAGAGVVSMSYYVLPYYAKYAVIEKGVESENWLIEEIPKVGFYPIYENDYMYVYQNQIFGW